MTVRIEDALTIPPDVGDLAAFRRWALSDRFPGSGRIDYLQGVIEVDMSPEDLQTHGVPKSALAVYVGQVVSAGNLGQLYIDRARLSADPAGLSCEPDLLFVSWAALRDGRVRYKPASLRRPERKIEVEGAADLAVEVVSDSSVRKDTKRLPPLYAAAGVRELWIADARGARLKFQIFHLHKGKYRPAAAEARGFQRSEVLGRSIRLRRRRGPVPDTWIFTVQEA
jgi:Uma2 family endonuclease